MCIAVGFVPGARGQTLTPPVTFWNGAGSVQELKFDPSIHPNRITPDRDADVWFTDQKNHAIGKITKIFGTPAIILFPLAVAPWEELTYLDAIDVDSDGIVYFEYTIVGTDPITGMKYYTDGEGSFDPETGEFDYDPIETGSVSTLLPYSSRAVDPSGAIWYTSPDPPYVLRRLNGEIQKLTSPVGELFPDGATFFKNAIYITELNAIAKITPDGVFTEYNTQPIFLNYGPDGNVWSTAPRAKLLRLTDDGHITNYNLPNPMFAPYRIVPSPDGAEYFNDAKTGNIGRVFTATATELGAQIELSGVLPPLPANTFAIDLIKMPIVPGSNKIQLVENTVDTSGNSRIFLYNISSTFACSMIAFGLIQAPLVQGVSVNVPILVTDAASPVVVSVADGNLPDGLAIENNKIKGTPTKAGTFTFKLQAKDAAGCTQTQNFTLTVLAGASAPKLSLLKEHRFYTNVLSSNPAKRIEYTFTVQNDGDKDYTGEITIDDPIPGGLSDVRDMSTGKVIDQGTAHIKTTVTIPKGGHVLVSGFSAAISPTDGTAYNNQATLSAAGLANPVQSNVDKGVVGDGEIVLSKKLVRASDGFRWEITLFNGGKDTTGDITIKDFLPPGADVDTTNVTGVDCNTSGSVVTCNLLDIAKPIRAGKSFVLVLPIKKFPPGTPINTVQLSGTNIAMKTTTAFFDPRNAALITKKQPASTNGRK